MRVYKNNLIKDKDKDKKMENNSIEAKIASLNNIQNIINRLADTSSKVKGLYVTLLSALLTIVMTYILPKQGSVDIKLYYFSAVIFFIVYACFFYIDNEYLKSERLMRSVYDDKANDIKKGNGKINYFDITGPYLEKKDKKKNKDKNKDKDKDKKKSNKSQLYFYLVPFALIELILIIIIAMK